MDWKLLGTLTVASIKMYFRNVTAVFFTLFIPVTLVIVFGLLSKSNGEGSIKISLTDKAKTQLSESYVKAIKDIKTFKVMEIDEEQARTQLEQAKIDLEVVIPEEFGKPGPNGLQPANVKAYYNKGKPQSGQTASLIIGQVTNGFNNQIVKTPQVLTIDSEGVQTRNLGYIDFLLPGIIAMSIMQLGIFSVAFGFIGYKTSGALRRLHATPTPASYFIGGQSITRLIIGVMQVVLLVALGVIFFDFHLGSVATSINFMLLAVFGTVVFLSMGFAIAGWARDENQAAPVANLIQFPQLFLSGIFFTREGFPPLLERITDFLPLTFLSEAMRQVSNEGASLWAVRGDILGLVIWGVITYLIAIRVFKWE